MSDPTPTPSAAYIEDRDRARDADLIERLDYAEKAEAEVARLTALVQSTEDKADDYLAEIESAHAERDALAAAHARESEKVWKVEEVMDDIEGSDPTTWERLRDALAGSDADATDTQPTGQERCPTCAKTRDDLTPGPHAEGWGHCPESFHFRNISTDQEVK